MNEDEIRDVLAIYIMQFGNLNYNIALKSLDNITKDDSLMKEFRSTPIPTLAKETVKLTEFTEEEKRKYRELQQVIYFHDPLHEGIMFAANARTWKAIPEKNRKMTPLEEDYYENHLMTEEEYCYWGKGVHRGDKPPKLMLYDPVKRIRKEMPVNKYEMSK